jgi:hypothetical protein
MKITRTYENAAGDILRVDELNVPVSNPVVQGYPTAGTNTAIVCRVGPQTIKTQLFYTTSGSRVVSSIKIFGDYTAAETSTGSFTWATKTLGNSQVVRADMSNLPIVTDSV